MKLGIAIPTYNEAANVSKLLDELEEQLTGIKDVNVTVLIIDDSSPDGTAEIVKKIALKKNKPNFKIELLLRKTKDGLGRAYIAGINKLLDQKVDYVLQMDADLSHNPKYIPAMIEKSKDHDLVVGSRYVPGGKTPDWTFFRKLQSKAGNTYAKLILSTKITDYTGGFNLYSSELLRAADINEIKSGGYGFLIELKYRALKNAKSVTEVPIVFNDRQHGKSKLPRSTIINNLILVPHIKILLR